ncbi:MAG: hypothetical protein EA362_04325 [Saprospirales bacterium]|nr:MAG: hypothetical protein EA362_04325 [Saprospirales bacterium]
MKNTTLLFILFIIFLLSQISISAQDNKDFDGAETAVFVEGLGNGLTFTFNYDTRILNRLGIRAGIGYVGDISDGDGITSIPLMINYLLGDGGNYFEIGVGTTIITGDFLDSNVFLTFSFMYRRQPPNGGFMWKAGFAPILAEGVFIPYFPGVSLGYSF